MNNRAQLPYEAGVLARRDGMIRQVPSYATPTAAREWARGYDDEQRRVNAAAQWMRDHAANVDEWGFV